VIASNTASTPRGRPAAFFELLFSAFEIFCGRLTKDLQKNNGSRANLKGKLDPNFCPEIFDLFCLLV
jgi:hypothetical protein